VEAQLRRRHAAARPLKAIHPPDGTRFPVNTKARPDSTDDRRREAGTQRAGVATWHSLVPLAIGLGVGAIAALMATLN
jgi:hypothetical protein